MLILAGVVVNVTISENGIFKVAKYAVVKNNEESAKEKLLLVLEDLRTHKYSSEDYNENEYIDDYLESKDIKVSGNIVMVDGIGFEIDREKLTIIGRKQGYVIIISQLKERLENGFANIVIRVESDKEIESVTFLNEDGTTLIVTTDKQSISKDLKVEIEKEYEVTVKTKDGEEVTQIIKIEKEKVREIILNKTTLELVKGENNTDTSLKVIVLPQDAEDKSLTWASSDENVATFSVSGDVITITAIGKGTATITATANDGSGKSASCKVTVKMAGEIEYSWEELGEIAKIISDKYGYEEGQINEDTEEINVNYKGKNCNLTVGDWTTVNDKKVRILGFNHDDLTNKNAYGEGLINTKAGISFEYAECITTDQINSTNTNANAWGGCALRTTLNGATLNGLENREQIKQVNKQYIKVFDNAGSVTISKDKLWLLSCSEIWNNGRNGLPYGYAVAKEGEQYKYYKNINADSSNSNERLVKKNNSSTVDWWLRSPIYNGSSGFCLVYAGGYCDCNHAYTTNGVVPGFSI